MQRKLSLLLAILMILSLFVAGCGGGKGNEQADTTDKNNQTSEETGKDDESDEGKDDEGVASVDNITEFKQSPMLDAKGLPPIEERLPKVPKITNEMPTDQLDYQIGKYGGTLRTVRMEPIWDGTVWSMSEEPLLNSPGRKGEEITPNVVKEYEVSDDQKEFTFVLREGMKWSDGEPVTTADVKFAYEDFINNEELNAVFPKWLRAGNQIDGTPVELEIIDEYTFKLKFDQPYGGFILRLTTSDYQNLIRPAHYLKQFHINHADPDKLAKLVEEAGFAEGEWYNLFNRKAPSGWNAGYPEAMDYPVLYPYIHVQDGDTRIFERNPYYFKVDSEGQQLPYIDYVESTLVQNMEIAGVKILAGEVDFSYEWVPLPQIALFKENEAKGGYRLLTGTTLHRTSADIFLNLTYDDPVWREVVQDIRFRQALNLALDKQDIVDTVYYGLADVSDMQGTEYNLDEANRILDEMGMTKGSDGFRTSPSGKKFTMHFTYSDWMTSFPLMAQLVAEQWKLLGIDVQLKQGENSYIDTLVSANDLIANTHFSHGPVFPMWDDWGYNRWGRLWDLWRGTNGKEGEEPPEDVKKYYKLVDSINIVPHEETQAVRQQLRDEMKKNLWYFIPVENVPQPIAVNAKLRNIDDAGFILGNSFAGEQWWLDE